MAIRGLKCDAMIVVMTVKVRASRFKAMTRLQVGRWHSLDYGSDVPRVKRHTVIASSNVTGQETDYSASLVARSAAISHIA